MFLKTLCPDCGRVEYINITVDVEEGRTRPIVVDSWVSNRISEHELIEKIIHNISYYENIDIIKKVVRQGFNVAPCNVDELSEKIFQRIAGPQPIEVVIT